MSDLGKAYVQIVPSAEGISGSISSILDNEATSAGKSAGLNIAGGIGGALKGAATAVAGATALVSGTIVKGTQDLASYGDNIDKMSQKMGLSAEAYQEWDAVMQHSGTSMEAMKSSMKTLANAAETGSAAFDALGISQEEIAKMSQEQLFEATIAALQNVESETERTYLAGKTLGKGATELGALLNTSAEDTQAMRDRVHELGGVMSDDAVKAAATYQDNMQDLQTAISGVGRGLMSELLPSMNDILAGFTSLITGEEGATEALSSGFSSLFESLDGIAEQIIGTLTEMLPTIISGITEVLPDLIELATELLVSLADALVNALPELLTTLLPALAEAAVNIITALGEALIEAGPALFNAGKELLGMLTESVTDGGLLEQGTQIVSEMLSGITEKLPDVLNEGVEILTNLVNGILESLPQLIETAGELLAQFAEFFMTNMPTIIETGAQMLLNLVNGIVDNLPNIIESVVTIIAQFVETIGENLPQILEAGIRIIIELAAGLIEAIPKIIAAIPKIVTSIFEAFASINWLEIGVNIINGIASGILGAIGHLVDAAVDAARAAFEAAKNFLGISSPSKEFMYIGKMTDEGFALGIERNAGMVTDALSDLSKDATAQFQTSAVSRFNVEQTTTNDDKMDLLLSILTDYLPEIAKNKGVDAKSLYNGLNRQLGWALS